MSLHLLLMRDTGETQVAVGAFGRKLGDNYDDVEKYKRSGAVVKVRYRVGIGSV